MGNPKGSCRSRVVKSVNGFIAFSSVSCHSSEVRRGRKGQKQFLKGSSMGNCWRLIILGYFNNNWTIVIFLKSKDGALMATRSFQFTFCLLGRRNYRLTFISPISPQCRDKSSVLWQQNLIVVLKWLLHDLHFSLSKYTEQSWVNIWYRLSMLNYCK